MNKINETLKELKNTTKQELDEKFKKQKNELLEDILKVYDMYSVELYENQTIQGQYFSEAYIFTDKNNRFITNIISEKISGYDIKIKTIKSTLHLLGFTLKRNKESIIKPIFYFGDIDKDDYNNLIKLRILETKIRLLFGN